jgi:hypothetical protein
MKKFTLLSLLLTTCLFGNAQALIAVETNGTTTFERSLDSAVMHAAAGSTIYIPGGVFTFNTVNIDKKLTIVGVGHHPDSTLATGQTIISGNVTFVEGSSQSHIEGLYITGNIQVVFQQNVDDLLIKRCAATDLTGNGSHWSQQDHDSTYSHNWQIMHSVFRGSINFANLKAFTFTNNIVKGRLVNAFHGGTLRNNVFLFNSQSERLMDEIRYCSISNNIFFHSWDISYGPYACYGGYPCGSYENVFLNNSFCMGGQSTYVENGTASVALNNKYDALPTESLVNATENIFSYAANYHIHPNLNAALVGTDGLQLGIYGSNDPYKEGAVPYNPHIQLKNIAPSTSTNGTLQVEIKVNAQQN